MVVSPASPIGPSQKVGMKERKRVRKREGERDWNRKRERERKTEGIPVVWHAAPKGAWPAVCSECRTVKNEFPPRGSGEHGSLAVVRSTTVRHVVAFE